ncbi:T9SS type A sorting domain-containing protein [bacterium SCSIO 12643]|nr:T9SS type A sorting domain-containing protein [bacterium SCSIO 12643]
MKSLRRDKLPRLEKPGSNNELIINTQSLDSGMYLLKVQSGTSRSQAQKFVVKYRLSTFLPDRDDL